MVLVESMMDTYLKSVTCEIFRCSSNAFAAVCESVELDSSGNEFNITMIVLEKAGFCYFSRTKVIISEVIKLI